MLLHRLPHNGVARQLGAAEKLFWLADQNRPTHFTIAAEVDGVTRIEQWQNAIDRVCRQSALVWSRIVPDKCGTPAFEPVRCGSVPIHVIENASPEWSFWVADELNRSFDVSKAPLIRATLLHGADRSTIILCAHHSIADGLALTYLMRDVLRTFAGEQVQRSAETAHVEDLVNSQRGPSSALPVEPTPTARTPMAYREVGGSPPRLEALRLSREITRSLRERARVERSTLHAALCAALTDAASTSLPGRSDAPVRVLSPIDVRRRWLSGSEHLGFCVTAALLEDVRNTKPFWNRARSFSDQLEPAKSAEGVAGLVDMVHTLGSSISTVQQAQEIFAKDFSAEILLTNLGNVEFKSDYGPLALHALWGPAVHLGWATGQTIGAVTVRDQLHLLHTSYTPAHGLLAKAETLLNNSLEESP
jgi:NRPS condensation-like uncharacterized protein